VWSDEKRCFVPINKDLQNIIEKDLFNCTSDELDAIVFGTPTPEGEQSPGGAKAGTE
jgi:hypothetical protein